MAADAKRMGRVQGESHANFRSGPDLRHRPLAILKKGDVVTVEEELENWYRVSLADGREGYVHKALLSVFDDPEARPAVAEETKAPPLVAPAPSPLPSAPKIAAAESSAIQPFNGPTLLEGLLAGICVFFLGWIFGGNYYLRRDRNRISRLRL